MTPTTRRIFTLATAEARLQALIAVRQAPARWIVRIGEPTRTLEQNNLQWVILQKFARQKAWPIDGKTRFLDEATWKEILTAAWRREMLQMAAGIYGGYVMVGMSTSDMGKGTFSEWLEFLHAVAAELGVKL